MIFDDTNEEYFPRGGTARVITKKRNYLFEKKGRNEPKAKKPGRRERKKNAVTNRNIESEEEGEKESGENNVVFERFERLTYKGLSEGTVALCSVRGIYDKYVDLCLPGRLSARLYIDAVSDPYSKILNKTISTTGEELIEEVAEGLHSLFRVGQHLACSVLGVTQPGHFAARVTADPAIVNSHLSFASVSEELVLQFAVQSIEDHGYMLFSGIPGLVCFLPSANAASFITHHQNNRPLCIGQIVWGSVTRTKLTSSSNTIQVTLDFDRIDRSILKEDISMDKLMPGVKVNVTINKVLPHTLMVTIEGSNIRGYIEESQLSTCWSQVFDYKVGSTQEATVLFKFPYARIIALSFRSGATSISKEEIKIGAVFQNSEVMAVMKRGVCLKLDHNGKSLKGMVSMRRLGDNADVNSVSSKFPIGNHITCRVIGYDALEETYSCSTEDKILKEKYLSSTDLKLGEPIEVTVDSFTEGGLEVSFGLLKGFVPAMQISDVVLQNPFEKVRIKSKYKGKIYKNDSSKVLITLRPTLVKNSSLTDFDKVKVGDAYYGSVTKILSDHIIVSFFGTLFTPINEKNLLEPPHKYSFGELVKCYVVEKKFGKRPVFSLLKFAQNMGLTVGNKYDLIVKKITRFGLTCFFMSQGEKFNGFLPLQHFSDYAEHCESEMKKHPYGSTIPNVLLMSINEDMPLFTLRQSVSDFIDGFPEICDGLKCLTNQMFLPCTVSEIHQKQILVCAPIPGYNGKIVIEAKLLPEAPSSYSRFQSIVARVKEVNLHSKDIKLTCRLNDEDKIKLNDTFLSKYLDFLKPLQTHQTGKTIKCVMKEMNSDFAHVFIPSTKTEGFLIGMNSEDLKAEEKLKALILFHDLEKDLVYLHPKNGNISLFESPPSSLINKTVPGTALYMNNQFILALVETSPNSQNLVFIRRMKDPNSLNYVEAKTISLCSPCFITLRSVHEWDCEDKTVYYWVGNSFKLKSEINDRKRHLYENNIIEKDGNDSDIVSKKKSKSTIGGVEDSLGKRTIQLVSEDAEEKVPKKKKKKNKQKKSEDEILISENNKVNKKEKNKKENKENNKNEGDIDLLEQAADFVWDATAADLAKAVVPSGDDFSEDDSEVEVEVRKKLTAAEKRAAAAERERDIRAKEEELLLAESKPESAEHFDRLVTASPNSSRIWIMYMAFHMQATEIEKARSVSKRALKHINVRLEDERLNVWIASLNLENIYGTSESFKEVLTEALKYNDDYKVYKRVLDIYSESHKLQELEKLVNQLVKKYRSNIDCWLSCQEALMKGGVPEKARYYLQRSLEALSKKEYCTLISRFALLENKFGFVEQAQSLFENLLTSYPKRTDVWFVYTDMLTKSNSVDLARNVLERATSQKLPLRKMKSLYQKWLKLEETFGDPESVQKVKDAAASYVTNLTSALKQNS